MPGTSFGNAAVIEPHGVVPVPTPGVLWRVPRYLMDPLGPLAIRWRNGGNVTSFDESLKPVVFDEIKYEGDIPLRWGNLSAEEMTHRFWECIIAGGSPGHGECYLSDDDVLWWSKGGVLKGESPARIAFLRG